MIAHPGVEEFPLLKYLRGTSPNIENLSCITAINFLFGPYAKYAKLSGPSGSLRISGWRGNPAIPSTAMDDQILRALGPRILSTTKRLTISDCKHPELADVEEWPIFRTLVCKQPSNPRPVPVRQPTFHFRPKSGKKLV